MVAGAVLALQVEESHGREASHVIERGHVPSAPVDTPLTPAAGCGTCAPANGDEALRQPLTAAQSADAEASGRAVMYAMARATARRTGRCAGNFRGLNPCGTDNEVFDDGDLAAARAALAGAGFPAAVIRLPRPTDTGPQGDLVYGVPLGAACAVGYVKVAAGIGQRIVGRLPDGNCLEP